MKEAVLSHLLKLVEEELTHELDPEKRAELEKKKLVLKFLPRREFESTDEIVPSSIVEIELTAGSHPRSYVLLIPTGGGWISEWNGKPLQIVTPYSPLGERLMGKKQGEDLQIETYQGTSRVYKILAHC